MVTDVFEAYLLEKVIDVLPALLARRAFPPEKVAKQIRIALRSQVPIHISFGTAIPRLDLYLQISNFSRFDLVVDRVLIDLWIGQPIMQGAILERYTVPKGDVNDRIYFTNQLTTPQQEYIKQYVAETPADAYVTLNLKAYLESKVGRIYKQEQLEHKGVVCDGLPKAQI